MQESSRLKHCIDSCIILDMATKDRLGCESRRINFIYSYLDRLLRTVDVSSIPAIGSCLRGGRLTSGICVATGENPKLKPRPFVFRKPCPP